MFCSGEPRISQVTQSSSSLQPGGWFQVLLFVPNDIIANCLFVQSKYLFDVLLLVNGQFVPSDEFHALNYKPDSG